MDSNSFSRLGRTNHHRQRTQQKVNPIVDDPKSSNHVTRGAIEMYNT